MSACQTVLGSWLQDRAEVIAKSLEPNLAHVSGAAGIRQDYYTVKVSGVGSQTRKVILDTVCATSQACLAVCCKQLPDQRGFMAEIIRKVQDRNVLAKIYGRSVHHWPWPGPTISSFHKY